MRKLLLTALSVLLVAASAFAQNRQVSGVVSGSDGSPITGVTVVLDGSANVGTITDISGRYSLSVPSNGTLAFSFIGMETHREAVSGRAIINVTMTDQAIQAEEVVVTAVGIARAERELGYSVAVVDANEGVQKAEPDLLRSLDGKIPGVVVGSPSGAPGSATRVTIRGNNSFLGDNQPLYVVDGVPYSNTELATSRQDTEAGGAYGSGISTLDPNDIESMSVLKGAAAAALYGSRAANGVVLITTKSGAKRASSQKGLEITFNSSLTLEAISGLPDYQNKFGQGSAFNFEASNGSWGPAFTDRNKIPASSWSELQYYYPNWAAEKYPELVENGVAYLPYKAYPNNVKDLFNTGTIWENSLNVSSVNDKGNFGLTVSRMNQESFQPGSDFERFNISVGGHQKLDNGLRIGGNLAFSNSIQNGSLYGNLMVSNDYGGLNSLGRAFILARNVDIANLPYKTPVDGANLLAYISAGQANNPLWAWENDWTKTDMNRMVANVNAGYDITDNISVDYSFGYNDLSMDRRQVINVGSNGYTGVGQIKTDAYGIREMEGTLLIGYNNPAICSSDFGVKATLGHNFNQRTTDRSMATGNRIISPGIYSLQNTESQAVSEDYTRRSLWGVFADVTLSYKTWAFLSLTGRNDFSSTLPTNNNNYFYPAVSGSFIFTEAFDITSDWLDFGKLRASWAKVGNDAGVYYDYANSTYLGGTPYLGFPQMGLPTSKFDPNLKPEFTSEVEVGLEMAFFRGRLGFDVSLYNKNTTDQIAPLSSPATSGTMNYYTNFGKLNNKGIELGVNATPVMYKDFSWSIYGTFTHNQSEVKELAMGLNSVTVTGTNMISPIAVLEVGQPYGMLKGSVIARDEDGNPLVDAATGRYILSEENGYIGNPNPKYKTSLSNTFSYKGVSLNVMFDFQKGGCVYSTYIPDLLGRGVSKDTEDRYGTRILDGVLGDINTRKPILDANDNKIPNTTQITEQEVWFTANSTVSALAINSAEEMNTYDATTLRLREISLGWDLPKRWLAKTFIGSANISVVGRNLWYWAPNVPKYSNWDPTASSLGAGNVQGIEYLSTPSTRRIGFNVRVTF